MIVLLAELFLDGRLSTRPDRAARLAEILCCPRGAWGGLEELWTPWALPERAGGLRVRNIDADQLTQPFDPAPSGIALLGDAAWNRDALESGRVEEIRVRWLPEFGDGDAEPFVSGFRPPEGPRLPLCLLQWRREGGGGIIGRYAVVSKGSGS